MGHAYYGSMPIRSLTTPLLTAEITFHYLRRQISDLNAALYRVATSRQKSAFVVIQNSVAPRMHCGAVLRMNASLSTGEFEIDALAPRSVTETTTHWLTDGEQVFVIIAAIPLDAKT